MDSNERIDRGLEALNYIEKKMSDGMLYTDLGILRYVLSTMKNPIETSAWIVNDTCNIPEQSHPVETSGYSTETPTYDGVIEHNKKITSVFIKGEQFVLFNPEGKVWLERAKEHLLNDKPYEATRCINEAIELIYGKVE